MSEGGIDDHPSDTTLMRWMTLNYLYVISVRFPAIIVRLRQLAVNVKSRCASMPLLLTVLPKHYLEVKLSNDLYRRFDPSYSLPARNSGRRTLDASSHMDTPFPRLSYLTMTPLAHTPYDWL
jgi:hypothetical protein